MTSRVVARGSEWGESALNDGWGEGPEGFEARMAALVVTLFEQLAEKAGYPVSWFPRLSEVHGNVDLDVEPSLLDNLRELALEKVLEGLVEDSGLMADEVAEQLAQAYAAASEAVELLVIYPGTASRAWVILGDDAGSFGDNGDDPDGPSYYRPVSWFEPEIVDTIVTQRFGHVQWGRHEGGYRGTNSERNRMSNIAPSRWCGYSSTGDLYYIIVAGMD